MQHTSKTLQGITDLTLLAPIKRGFVDSLDSCTYETRLRTLMKTLNTLRVSSREHSPIRPFSDTVERIQHIHSFRVAVIEPERNLQEKELPEKELREKKLLLAVTFDGAGESYIRLIWRDLGPLLDVIFCNCEGYTSAFHNSFEKYAAWIREHQVDSDFFYAASALTVSDLQYLRQIENLHRGGRDLRATDEKAVQTVRDDPEQAAADTIKAQPREAAALGLAALSALYRLTDLYPADTDDGNYLLRASHELLKEFRPLTPAFQPGSGARMRFGAQLRWFERAQQEPPAPAADRLTYGPDDVQGGILESYDKKGPPITHGCLLLMQVVDPNAARAFLNRLAIAVSRQSSPRPGDGVHINVALTYQGLARLGVPEAELARLPKEFREGMESRAGLLGDYRHNHPRNWTLPERNWPDRNQDGGIVARVELSAIDILLQLRISAELQTGDDEIVGNAQHPLYAKVDQLSREAGVRLLSVQPMLHHHNEEGKGIDHLGFVDGLSQPVVTDTATGTRWSDEVKRGEILCGYANDRRDGPPDEAGGAYLDNSTFLVIRKLGLKVQALHDVLKPHVTAGLTQDDLLARMMGRTLKGEPLVDAAAASSNDFDYEGDKQGAVCPFQAHIRRANPRTRDKKKAPRIMRRGMSYGPRFEDTPAAERGLVFMAYNASIAEQFEVLQRWISGGNSSGVSSGQSDPFLGVPQPGDPRTFRFLHNGAPVRIDLDGAQSPPFARLEWGAYLFVPSLPALKKIAGLTPSAPSSQVDGKAIIEKLLELEAVDKEQAKTAWKAYLEDHSAREDGSNAAVWAAIRQNHGGVLRTPYGVLVADSAKVKEVFLNQSEHYSVREYLPRMRESIGEIYLGLDDGPTYKDQSRASNVAIQSITEPVAFATARHITDAVLTKLLDGAAQQPPRKRETAIDINRDLSDRVLAALSSKWFDLPGNEDHVAAGGSDWAPDPHGRPRCPADFTSPSRYVFSPNPGPGAERYGKAHGRALHTAVKEFIKSTKTNNIQLQGPLSKAMFAAIPDDNDLLARTIVGVMMGFLPTVDGNLRSTLYEWVKDRTLWRLQQALVSHPDNDEAHAYVRATDVLKGPLMRTMQRRPVPYLVWRTAAKDHDLGNVKVKEGETIVVGIVSATQEDLAAGDVDVFPIFGGERSTTAAAPTHACPGYHMGMGVLLGMISGLLEMGTLRPTPAPLTLTLTGRTLKSSAHP